jgi:hypothetical protein
VIMLGEVKKTTMERNTKDCKNRYFIPYHPGFAVGLG